MERPGRDELSNAVPPKAAPLCVGFDLSGPRGFHGPMESPRYVLANDRPARRRAATTAAKAYAFAPSTLLTATGAALLMPAIFWAGGALTGRPLSVLWLVATYIGVWLLFLPLQAAIIGAGVYHAPCSKRLRRLCFLEGEPASASVLLQPDRRRHALPGDVLMSNWAAWPKRRSAGSQLGEWVRESEHAAGNRVTATATRFLVKTYERHGMVVDGRRGWVMTRIDSRPR